MAKTVRLNPEVSKIVVPGIGTVTAENLTLEIYERIMATNDSHAAFFIVEEDSKPKSK